MQFLEIDNSTTLSELADRLGSDLNAFLHVNGVPRVPNVGSAYLKSCQEIMDSPDTISASRKISVLSTMTTDTDIFQTAALTDESGWKLLSARDTLPGTMKVPSTTTLPSSDDTMGDGQPVPQSTFNEVARSLRETNSVDPAIFNDVSTTSSTSITTVGGSDGTGSNPMNWFQIPWGDITLYTSLDDSYLEFPVYPEELSDGRKANYTTMPDMLYQYEPWQIYTGSGPRSTTYSFTFHRDMWTGDHRDGKANELIRGCMANLYPKYSGSAVNTSLVTLFIHGSPLIRGILTDVNVNWSGPLGLDGWYLVCKLDLQITEVSAEPLSFDVMKSKSLIG